MIAKTRILWLALFFLSFGLLLARIEDPVPFFDDPPANRARSMKLPFVLLGLACVAAMLPPLPPTPATPKKHKVSAAAITTKGAGAQALLIKPHFVVPPTKALVWDWKLDASNDWTNIVFLVRSSPDLKSWTFAGVATTNRWSFLIDPSVPAAFFSVIASNTVSHLVSP